MMKYYSNKYNKKAFCTCLMLMFIFNVVGQKYEFDNSFGDSGIAMTKLGRRNFGVGLMAKQSDGKIVLVGHSWRSRLDANFDLILTRFTKDGILDSSFGLNGIKILDIKNVDNQIRAIKVQSDDKIVLCVFTTNNASAFDYNIIRFNKNGDIDNTFGTNGFAVSPFSAADMFIQTDGKIVVGGTISKIVNGLASGDFGLIRFTSNGQLDNSFAVNGIATVDFNKNEVLRSIDFQSDGKIIVLGVYDNGITNNYLFARFTQDGVLDNSFALSGKRIINNFNGAYFSILGIDQNDKIFALGDSPTSQVDIGNFYIIKLDANGALDPSFGGSGIVQTKIKNSRASAGAMTFQEDGKVLIFGMTHSIIGMQVGNIASLRYRNNGYLDSSYGINGLNYNLIDSGEYFSSVNVVVQNDDKILISGTYGYPNKDIMELALVRLKQSNNSKVDAKQVNYSIKLYPNPVNGFLKVETESFSDLYTVQILNDSGTEVFENKYNGSCTNLIDISNLSQGAYLLIVSDGTHYNVKKFVKI
jgi:uncharacterized delta-60 repeat protein